MRECNYVQMTHPFCVNTGQTNTQNTALNNFAYTALNLDLFMLLYSLIMAKS